MTYATTSVLCPWLYGQLKQLFGKVKIANPRAGFVAQPMVLDGRRQLVTVHPGEYYRVCCPFCGDQRNRLWINHKYGQFDEQNRRMAHLAICYNEDCLRDWSRRKKLLEDIYGYRNVNDRTFQPQTSLGDVAEPALLWPTELPGQCIPIWQLPVTHSAVQYMVCQRRYPMELLMYHQVHYCIQADPRWPMTQDRIILPISMRGQIVGWQSRYVGDIDWKAYRIPKYYSMPDMPKRLMLYNYDHLRAAPFIVVVEGPTDTWPLSDMAGALLGKTCSFSQQQILRVDFNGKPIVLMLDGGEEERDAMRAIQQSLMIGEARAPVLRVELPDGHDPGSTPREHLLQRIYATAAQAGVPLPTL